MISYAQNFEDVILRRVFESQSIGHYVDVGAFDPMFDSVTKHFYDQGWSGINVEPNPRCYALLEAARPRDHNVNCAASYSDGEPLLLTVPREGPEGWATVSPQYREAVKQRCAQTADVQVSTLTLDTIISNSPLSGANIDFLKIDVEGFEYEVLTGIDLKRTRPTVIVVEAIAPGSRCTDQPEYYAKQHDYLVAHKYSYRLFDGVNRYYLADEHVGISDRLDAPANAMDDFVSFQLLYAGFVQGRAGVVNPM
ncbi:MAG: FkbM family methyltransferase [Ferrimicrobium acidiphilum]